MKLNTLLFVFCFSFFFINCNDKNANKLNIPEENTLKDISELTYVEIYHQLFTKESGGVDMHGEMFGQEAVSSLKFSNENSSCGEALFITNSDSVRPVSLAIKASFSFPGNTIKEISRIYFLKPTEKLPIGHSLMCYNGKEYIINRDIISAGFK